MDLKAAQVCERTIATFDGSSDSLSPAAAALAQLFGEADATGLLNVASTAVGRLVEQRTGDAWVQAVCVVDGRYLATCRGLGMRTCDHTSHLLRDAWIMRHLDGAKDAFQWWRVLVNLVAALEAVRTPPPAWTIASVGFWADSVRTGRLVKVAWSKRCEVAVGTGGFRVVANARTFDVLTGYFRMAFVTCMHILPPVSGSSPIPDKPSWRQILLKTPFPVTDDFVMLAALLWSFHLFGEAERAFGGEAPTITVVGTDDAPFSKLDFDPIAVAMAPNLPPCMRK